MTRIRNVSDFVKKIKKEWEDNPIVERLEDAPISEEGLTTEEHIKELQEILVQTCIDYINKHGLKDIYAVRFNADSLSESAEFGSWQACTDSYIKVEGIRVERHRRKNGEIFEMPYTYDIGEYM